MTIAVSAHRESITMFRSKAENKGAGPVRRGRLAPRIGRMAAVAIVTAGLFFSMAVPANAAAFDYRGELYIPATAQAAQVLMNCNSAYGTLNYTPHSRAPNWFYWSAHNLNTGAVWKSQWISGAYFYSNIIIRYQGDYRVSVVAAGWTGAAYNYDVEHTFVNNAFPYDRRGECHVGR